MEKQIFKAKNNLLQWYQKHGREHLPWRNPTDVYHVYISEVMLQQTQVSRVQDHYYPHFLEKYPTIQDLANSELDDLLTSWSGLGYYSRARNLHKTANICANTGIPDCMKALQKLPGIGKYTASAICSFGYNQTVSVVDTNIARVLKRFFALENPKDTTVWEYADKLLNHQEPTKHNLALMDLGSMICTPVNPKCQECPFETFCLGQKDPTKYTQTKKVQYENLDLFFGVFIKNQKIALVKSKEKLYNSMLIFPKTEPIEENFITSYKHSYTKYKITVNLYKIETLNEENIIWIDFEDIDEFPLANITKKGLKLLSD